MNEGCGETIEAEPQSRQQRDRQDQGFDKRRAKGRRKNLRGTRPTRLRSCECSDLVLRASGVSIETQLALDFLKTRAIREKPASAFSRRALTSRAAPSPPDE